MLAAVAFGDGDDQLLADVTREIEIDVRDRVELAVEETAERELCADRIDVREAGQVADQRADRRTAASARRQCVARRIAAAHLERAFARELEHVPVQEEESREPDLVDELQLFLEPRQRLVAESVALRIPLLEGPVANVCELDDRGLWAVGEVRVAVAELLRQVETQPFGELDGSLDRCAVRRETLHHLCRREQDALMIAAPRRLAAVERAAVADGDEDVLQRCPAPMVRMDVAGHDRRDTEHAGEIAQSGVATRVAALVRTLELDEEAVRSEGARQSRSTVRITHGDAVPRTTGKADEPVVKLLQQALIERGVRSRLSFLSFWSRVGMGSSDQPAEVRVALRRLDQEGDVRAIGECQLGAGDWTHAEMLGRVRELERAVDAVVVRERQRGIAELGRADGELFRQRSPVEER